MAIYDPYPNYWQTCSTTYYPTKIYQSCDAEVIVNGRTIRAYPRNVEDGVEVFIEGRAGSKYSIKLKNNNDRRVLAVVHIDGLNILNGKKYSEDSRAGYVIEPNSSMVVDGWRTDNDTVAQFEFGKTEDSYASGNSKKRDIGLIKIEYFVAFDLSKFSFTTHTTYTPYDNYWDNKNYTYFYNSSVSNDCGRGPVLGGGHTSRGMSSGSQTVPAAGDVTYSANTVMPTSYKGDKIIVPNSMQSDMGTGFGEAVESHVVDTFFTPESNCPNQTITIRYASKDKLVEWGVLGKQKPKVCSNPNFCKPPKNWKK